MKQELLLHYSYMELELISILGFSLSISFITLFLYGIGALILINSLAIFLFITLFLYGIGAIFVLLVLFSQLLITLFLYGIGAVYLDIKFLNCCPLHYSYMELERINKISKCIHAFYYIIPIWNWSMFC